MKSTTNNKKILIVVEDIQHGESARITSIAGLVESILNSSIEILEWDKLLESDLDGVSLVIATAKLLPMWARTAKVPMLVLEPETLFQMGMAFGMPHKDYGVAQESSIQVHSDIESHKLSAGLEGRLRILDAKGHSKRRVTMHGWAVPSPAAYTVACFPPVEESHAAVFAYEAGAQMPALGAPDRRAAFLLSFDQITDLSTDTVELFLACLIWCVDQQKNSMMGTTREFSLMRDVEKGFVTKNLSLGEYEDWMRSRVTNSVLGKLSAAFSIIGVVGIFTMITLVGQYLKTQSTSIKAEVKDELETQVDKSVSEAIFAHTQIVDTLNEAIKATLKDNPKLRRTLAQSLSDQISDEMSTAILNQSIEILDDISLHEKKRMLPLELILTFLPDEQDRQKMLVQSMFICDDNDPVVRMVESPALLRLIFENYDPGVAFELPPKLDSGQSSNPSELVLTHLLNRLNDPAHVAIASELGESFLQSFPNTTLMSRLPDWLNENTQSSHAPMVTRVLAQIANMSRSTETREAIVRQFLDLLDNGEAELSSIRAAIGWYGLASIDPDEFEIGEQLRRKLLEGIWSRLELESALQPEGQTGGVNPLLSIQESSGQTLRDVLQEIIGKEKLAQIEGSASLLDSRLNQDYRLDLRQIAIRNFLRMSDLLNEDASNDILKWLSEGVAIGNHRELLAMAVHERIKMASLGHEQLAKPGNLSRLPSAKLWRQMVHVFLKNDNCLKRADFSEAINTIVVEGKTEPSKILVRALPTRLRTGFPVHADSRQTINLALQFDAAASPSCDATISLIDQVVAEAKNGDRERLKIASQVFDLIQKAEIFQRAENGNPNPSKGEFVHERERLAAALLLQISRLELRSDATQDASAFSNLLRWPRSEASNSKNVGRELASQELLSQLTDLLNVTTRNAETNVQSAVLSRVKIAFDSQGEANTVKYRKLGDWMVAQLSESTNLSTEARKIAHKEKLDILRSLLKLNDPQTIVAIAKAKLEINSTQELRDPGKRIQLQAVLSKSVPIQFPADIRRELHFAKAMASAMLVTDSDTDDATRDRLVEADKQLTACLGILKAEGRYSDMGLHLLRRGGLRKELGKLEDADRDFARAIEVFSTGLNEPEGAVKAKRRLGLAYLCDEKFDQAGSYTKESTSRLFSIRDQLGSLENLGMIDLRNGRFTRAFETTTKVKNEEESLVWNWFVRAVAAFELAQRETDAEQKRELLKQASDARLHFEQKAALSDLFYMRYVFLPKEYGRFQEIDIVQMEAIDVMND